VWDTVLVLALIAVVDPVRIGIAALLISGPRPMLNLLAFWLGGMAMGIAVALAALFVLRDFAVSVSHSLVSATANSTFGYIQIVVGVVALPVAALIAIRYGLSQRTRVSISAGGSSNLVPSPSTPTTVSRLLTPARLERATLGVALFVGLGSATPVEYLVAIIAILTSGAAAGAQVSAAIVFTLMAFAVVEIPLVSYLASPAKTHAVMLQLSDWIGGRRRPIVASIIALIGVYLAATGARNV
jgi:hypothetical protein